MWRKTVIEIISLLFVFLFVYAATVKLADYQKFVVQLGQSAMLTRWASLAGWLVPLTELMIALLLLGTRTRTIALYASLNLMIMFTAYIFIMTHYSAHVPCSCGGVLERMGWTEHLFFNTVFIVLALVALILDTQLSENQTALTIPQTYR